MSRSDFVAYSTSRYTTGSDLLESVNAASEIRGLIERIAPFDVFNQLSNIQFLILKPDAVASGKITEICQRLAGAGIVPIWSKPLFHTREHEYETLYRYNIDLANAECVVGSIWLARKPYLLGPAIALLVTSYDCAEETVYEKTRRLKGPSNPYLCVAGTLRHDLNACSRAMNLVHLADDPISTIREFLIFAGIEELALAARLLDRDLRPLRTFHYDSLVQLSRMSAALGPIVTDADYAGCLIRTTNKLLLACMAQDYRQPRLELLDQSLPEQGPRARLRIAAKRMAQCNKEIQRFVSNGELDPNDELLRQLVRMLDIATIDATAVGSMVHFLAACGIPLADWDELMIETNAHFGQAVRDALAEEVPVAIMNAA